MHLQQQMEGQIEAQLAAVRRKLFNTKLVALEQAALRAHSSSNGQEDSLRAASPQPPKLVVRQLAKWAHRNAPSVSAPFLPQTKVQLSVPLTCGACR